MYDVENDTFIYSSLMERETVFEIFINILK